MNTILDTLEQDGRVWCRNALNCSDMKMLNLVSMSNKFHSSRINWNSPQASILKQVTNLHNSVRQLLPEARPVRALYFNKSQEDNWVVPWHQDRVIAVKDKHDIKGYKNWTRKSGVWHVEPPTSVLDKMVFARIHLEDNTEAGGCMEIAIGTHNMGKIPANEISRTLSTARTEMCVAVTGDILILKALILHRSGKSVFPGTRKTLRIDYCHHKLPDPLQWAYLD